MMPAVFRLAAIGREELGTLVGRTDVALGDSEFNRQELAALGFSNTGVFPSRSISTASETRHGSRRWSRSCRMGR